jgi:hypothetical protein
VSGDQPPELRIEPEPTPAETEAVRQALAALGLIEAADAEPQPSGGSEPAP